MTRLPAASAPALAASGALGWDGEPVKVGILHPLSGAMAISETTLKDVMLMLVERRNEAGGRFGRPLAPVAVDPASGWPLFVEKARELIEVDGVDGVFGCRTSVSRTSAPPVFEEPSILFYPMRHEGEESRRNLSHAGAAPITQAIAAVDNLTEVEGVERRVLEGADSANPRMTNRILEQYLLDSRGAPEDISVNSTPFGHADWPARGNVIHEVGGEGKKTAEVSTINGDANAPFYEDLANHEVKASDVPLLAFAVGGQELIDLDAEPLVGHLAAWSRLMSIDPEANGAIVEDRWELIGSEDRVASDPMEVHRIGVDMRVEAVGKAGTTGPDAMIDAMIGVAAPNLSGGYSAMTPNRHVAKPVFVGEIRDDGPSRSCGRPPASSPATPVRRSAGERADHRRLARADALRERQYRDRPVRRPEPAAPR